MRILTTSCLALALLGLASVPLNGCGIFTGDLEFSPPADGGGAGSGNGNTQESNSNCIFNESHFDNGCLFDS